MKSKFPAPSGFQLAALITAVLVSSAYSVTFHSPNTVTLVQSSAYFPVNRLVQGAGVGYDAAPPHNASGSSTWVTNASGGDYYAAPVGATPILRFDLGSDVLLSEISTWGYSNGNSNGAKDFSLRFATAADGTGGFGTSITYNPSFIAAFSATTRDRHDFSELVTARYVEMTITDNYGGIGGFPAGGDRVGLGEVAFGASGTGAWALGETPSIGHIWAQLSIQLNINFNNAMLVWDSSDQGTSAPGAWANSTVLGAVNSGEVIAQATPLTANTAYVARFYGIDGAGAEGWSEPISFTSNAAPFYDSTSSLTQSSEFYAAVNLGQGEAVGFDASAPYIQLGAVNSSYSWVTNGSGTDYFSVPIGATPILVFDLGSDVLLREISTWNYAGGNRARDFNLRFATSVEGTGSFGSSISYNPTFIAGLDFSARDHHTFSEFVSARYVEMTITDNYRGFSGGGAGGDRVGLGEVAFGASGLIAWTLEDVASVGDKLVQLTALLNANVANAILVWDSSDQGTSAPGAWANSTVLGAVNSGQVIAQATPLTANTAYVARFYAVDGGEKAWSEPISFTSNAAPFYNSTPTLVQSSQFFPLANLSQGEGLGFDASAPFNRLGSTWVTNASGGDYYAAPVGATPIITFDLGSDILLREISTWGYSNGNANGAKDFSLRFATDAEGTGGFGTSVAYNPTFIADRLQSPRDNHAFSEFVTARYVEMTITDNYHAVAGAGAGGDRVGLGEVAFGASGLVAWTDEAQPSRGNTWAQFTALLNTSVANAILVWDSSDQGTSAPGAWANSTVLGAVNSGEVIAQATPLTASTAYVARLYAANAGEEAWSEPISFTTSAAPFYNSPSSLIQSSEFYLAVNLGQGEGVGFDSSAPYNQLGSVGPALSWVTNASGVDYFTGTIGPTPILLFDLGSDVLLSEISTWNYGGANRARDFNLRFATSAEGIGNFGNSISYNPTFIAGLDYATRSSQDFSGHVMARYVEMTITDNYRGFSGGGAGGDRVGLGEVAFEQIAQPAGSVLWFNHSATVDGPDTATLQALVNRPLVNTILVWDTSDKGTASTGDWANSVSLGAQNAGAISERITGLLQTTYTWRFFGIDSLATQGWSDADTFTNGIFYPSTATLVQSSEYFPVSRIAQGVGIGIGATAPYNQVVGSNTWVTNGSGADYFAAPIGATPIIVFDLGSDVLLGEISTWGYADGNVNGAREYSLRFATQADGTGNFGTSVTYNPGFVAGRFYSPRSSARFSEWVTARYVEMTITDNYFGTGAGGDRVGLGEVAFERTFPSTVFRFR